MLRVEGGIRPAIRIQADLSRLAAYGIGLEDLRTAIVGANVAGPKGAFDGAHQSYTIAANDQIETADAYKSVVVAYRNAAPVLLSDVAEEGLENDKVGTWYQGKPAVVIDVQRQPGANVIETVQRLRAELPRLQHTMPPALRSPSSTTRTDTIRASVRDVQFTLVLRRRGGAGGLGVPALVARHHHPGVALPLSLIATFGVMWFRLRPRQSVAHGVDRRHRLRRRRRHRDDRERRAPHRGRSAAAEGSIPRRAQIGFTMVSLTVSLIAVFIPLLFMTGVVGRLFREFALTLTIAVVASAIVSLTLTPMMCGRLLRQSDGEEHSEGILTNRFTTGLTDLIERTVVSPAAWSGCWTISARRLSSCWSRSPPPSGSMS